VRLVVTVLLGLALLLAPVYAAIPDDPLPPVWAYWLSAGTFAAALVALLAAWRGDRTFLQPLSRAEQAFLVLLGLAFLSISARLIVQHGTGYFGSMLRGWANLATGFAAFALARRVASRRTALYGLVFAAIAASVIVADIGVQEYVSHVRAGDPHARTFATSTPDYLAAYFVLLLPVTLAAFLQPPAVRGLTPLPRALVRFVLGVILLFQLASLLTTGSRFALLSLSIALIVFAAALRRALRHGLALDKATRRTGVALGVGFLLGILVFARPVLGRLGNLNDNSAAFRLWTWKGAVNMAAANPVLGTGIGTWEDLYPRYALTGFTRAAHESYLQLADECGVPALLALLATWGLLGSSLARGLTAAPLTASAPQGRQSKHPAPPVAAAPPEPDTLPTDHRLLLCGLLAALAGGVVQNLIDSDWYVFSLGFTFWTLAGLAAGSVASPTAEGRPARPLLFAAGGVAAACAALSAAQGVAAIYAARAKEQTATDPQGAARAYTAARTWDPLNARYASDQGYKVFDRRLGQLTEAEAAARAAVALAPNSVNYRRLGDILQQFGRQPEALAAYESGLRAEPHSLDLLLRLARLSPPPRALGYYHRMSDLELTPVGTVRALGEYVETNFAVADAVLGDEAVKTDPAQAAGYYSRAAHVLEQYADGGGSRNSQQQQLNGGRPDPQKDVALRGLCQHVLTAWIALATPGERETLRQRQEKYQQIYDALIAQSSKSGTL
jgi:O-antigen ligase